MDPWPQLFCAIGMGGDVVVTPWHRSGTKTATWRRGSRGFAIWRQWVSNAET